MKIPKLFSLLILGAIMTTTACKKDKEDTTEVSDTTPVKKTCYMKKLVKANNSYNEYEYNTNHLLTKAIEYDSLGSEVKKTELTYNYKKNVAKVEIFKNGSIFSKYIYTYNKDLKIIKAEYWNTIYGVYKKTGYYEYVYTDDKLTSIIFKAELYGQAIISSKSVITYKDDNAIKLVEYTYNYITASLEQSRVLDFEYDDKLNPSRGIGEDNIAVDVRFLSKNNVTKMTIANQNGVVDNVNSFNYTYEYNDNGYPLKVNFTSFNNANTGISNIEYDCI
jgi:hypothetical protein